MTPRPLCAILLRLWDSLDRYERMVLSIFMTISLNFPFSFVQTTNLISFLFSLFGTGMIIQRYGLQVTLISFPALLLACAVIVYVSPTIWVVFAVMMVMKGMSYALNNPTKEILYQVRMSCVDIFPC